MSPNAKEERIKSGANPVAGVVRRLSIRSKLVVMLAVPLVGLVAFAGIQVSAKSGVVSENRSLVELSGLVAQSNAMVHEMQKERGASALYLGSGGESYIQELAIQRGELDERRADLDQLRQEFDAEAYGAELVALLSDLDAGLGGLGAHRAAVDSLLATGADNLGYYTPIVSNLLETGSVMASTGSNREVAELALANVSIAQAKEAAGVERAVLANGIAAGGLDAAGLQKFLSLVATQDTYIDVFLHHATDEQVAAYEKLVVQPIMDTVDGFRSAAAAGEYASLDAGMWFDAATERLSLVRTLEVRTVEDLAARADELALIAQGSLVHSAILALFAAFAGLIIAWFLTRNIVSRVNGVAAVAAQLAEGDVSADLIDNGYTDEIGKMEAAFGRTIEYLREAAEVAARIADGDLAADFDVRSDQDTLGNAITDMTESLREVVGRALRVTEAVGKGSEILAQSSRESANAATEVADAIGGVAEGATSQAGIVDDVARAAKDISTEAGTTTKAVQEVVGASGHASGIAGDGQTQIDQVTQAMSRITNSFDGVADTVSELDVQSKRVEEIVDLIRTIAGQTNLLALNAAIEAARAGESGRGFAVVASEVKTLAEEASKSTEQIAEIVAQMRHGVLEAVSAVEVGRKQVDDGSSVVGSAGEAFDAIADAVGAINSLVNGVSESASRIESGTQVINDGMTNLAAVAESNSATSEEVAAAGQQAAATAQEIGSTAVELSASSEELAAAMARFHLEE